jgi:uncharacterized protein (DUF2267 family)
MSFIFSCRCDNMNTGIRSLDSSLQTTLEWISEIQDELGWTDKEKVYKATKAVLQAMRDRLPIEEVIHVTAELPLVMKGMMFDGYDYSGKPMKIKTIEEFFSHIQEKYGAGQGEGVNADEACRGVMNIVSEKLGEGEMAKINANLPEHLRPLFQHRTSDQSARQIRTQTTRRKLEIPT